MSEHRPNCMAYVNGMSCTCKKISDHEVLGFCAYITENRERHYGCRGIGKEYDEFYNKFIIGKSYKCIIDDFPWDYFYFTDINDEQKFLEKYSSKIDYQIS